MDIEAKKARLATLSPEELRAEVGALHGFLPPAGYAIHRVPVEGWVYAREVRPGVWVSLSRAYDAAGWSWYINRVPGTSYFVRGGACFCEDAVTTAEIEVSGDVYPWEPGYCSGGPAKVP